MFVTLYTDASPVLDRCAWAFFIKSEMGRLTESGISAREIADSNHAEMYAICKGVVKVIEVWPHTERILVKTDSLTCIHCIQNVKGWSEIGATEYGLLCKDLLAYCNENNTRLIPQHVKAHTGGKDVPSYVNRWCDRQCRTQRRIYLETRAAG